MLLTLQRLLTSCANMNAPIIDAFDCSSRKPMRRHFVSGFPRALLSLGQEKSSGVEIEITARTDFRFEKKLNFRRSLNLIFFIWHPQIQNIAKHWFFEIVLFENVMDISESFISLKRTVFKIKRKPCLAGCKILSNYLTITSLANHPKKHFSRASSQPALFL